MSETGPQIFSLEGAADVQRLADFFRRESESAARSDARWRWQYLDNPVGELFVDAATMGPTDGPLDAVYCVMPTYLRVEGQRHIAFQSLDTLVGKAARRQGLFKKLAHRNYARLAERGKAVYGFPNGNSAHGFFERLEWKSFDPVPFLVRPLKLGYVRRKVFAKVPGIFDAAPIPVPRWPLPFGMRFEEPTAFGPEADAIWEDFAGEATVAVERDARYLNWRVLEKPGVEYRALELRVGGRLVAHGAYTVVDKHGGRIGYVLDVLHRRRDVLFGQRLLAEMLRRMQKDGAELALAWSLPHSPNFPAYASSGFVPLPERFRFIELHAGARGFDATLPLERRDRWYLSYCDSDTV